MSEQLHLIGNNEQQVSEGSIYSSGLRIDIVQLETSYRRIHSAKENYLMLFPTYLFYKEVVKSSTLDDDDGLWKDKDCNYRFTRMRKDIAEVTMLFNNTERLWQVDMEFAGLPSGNCVWLYQDPKDALKVYEQLQQYFITK